MELQNKKRRNEILTMQEYLDRRKTKQSIDQTRTECYDTEMKFLKIQRR